MVLKKKNKILTNSLENKGLKNGPSITQPLKKTYFKLFKDCIPQILLGPFLNGLFHISIMVLRNIEDGRR